jgi:hypothetical protein
MKRILLTVAYVLSLPASAAETAKPDPLALCEVAGAAYGAQKELVASVASRLVTRAGLTSSDAKCGPIWREAYQIGRKTSQGNLGSQSEMQVIMRMQAFEAKVLDAVIEKISF